MWYKIFVTTLLVLVPLVFVQQANAGQAAPVKPGSITGTSTMSANDYRQIKFATITGDTTSLAAYAGKVVLIVNVASKCGYTPQYTDLEKLYQTYKDSGLVVIGFPANNFKNQEPGTNKEILDFCTTSYNVTFPLMAKISVLGPDKHPLFVALTEKSNIPGEIKWNFSKFLLDRNGNLVARFDSPVKPMSDEMLTAIRKALHS